MIATLTDVLGSALLLVGAATYAYQVWRRRVAPNAVTWSLWFVIPLVTFFAEVAGHAGLPALLTLAASLGPLLVLIAAGLVNRGYWRVGPASYGCAGLSLISLVVWAISRDGDYAILLSISADLFAALPTLYKAYRSPESEDAMAFVLGAAGTCCVLLTLPRWDLPSAGFPIYALVVNGAIAVLVARPRLTGAPGRVDDRG